MSCLFAIFYIFLISNLEHDGLHIASLKKSGVNILTDDSGIYHSVLCLTTLPVWIGWSGWVYWSSIFIRWFIDASLFRKSSGAGSLLKTVASNNPEIL